MTIPHKCAHPTVLFPLFPFEELTAIFFCFLFKPKAKESKTNSKVFKIHFSLKWTITGLEFSVSFLVCKWGKSSQGSGKQNGSAVGGQGEASTSPSSPHLWPARRIRKLHSWGSREMYCQGHTFPTTSARVKTASLARELGISGQGCFHDRWKCQKEGWEGSRGQK